MTTLGAVFLPQLPPSRLRPVAEAADAAGLEELWLWEDCFRESGVATAAAALAWTDRLRVGIGLLPVPLRNVALTAMEMATLERAVPRSAVGRPRPRRPGLDGPGRRAGGVAADAAARAPRHPGRRCSVATRSRMRAATSTSTGSASTGRRRLRRRCSPVRPDRRRCGSAAALRTARSSPAARARTVSETRWPRSTRAGQAAARVDRHCRRGVRARRNWHGCAGTTRSSTAGVG